MSSTAIDDTLARAAGGDEGALGEIFREFHQPLYRYCLAILGNRQDAEDALQETMVKVLGALPGERREIALKPWLYRVAHNESIDLLRRRRPSVSLEEGEPLAEEGLTERVETRQRLRQLIVDLGALPERQRGVLLMREAGGLDFEEIAAALETSQAVARQTLYEARLGLREMEGGREMECAAVTQALSDGDRRVRRRRDVRAHLRDCAGCRQFAEQIDTRREDLAAISPLPAVAAAALLHGALGGGGAGAAAAGGVGAGPGGGAGGAIVGGAAKSVGTATLLKGAATVAVVAVVGAGVADREGLVHIGSHQETPASHSGAGREGGSSGGGTSLSGGVSSSGPASARSTRAARKGSLDKARSVSPELDHGNSASAAPATPVAPAAEAEAGSPSPGNSGAEHPHGRGHEKQTPAAAAHGQETAASKPEKSTGSHHPAAVESGGSATAPDPHPVHPTHPAHPTHPVKPETPAEPGSPGKSEGKKPE